jgi:hypothetical protein
VEDAKAAMAITSIMGAAAGIYYVSVVNPLNNYFIFMVIFALVGIVLANVVLLVGYEVYRWLKKNFVDVEKPKVAQTA